MTEDTKAKIKEFLSYLEIECGYSDKTISAYEDDLNNFFKMCPEKDATKITRKHIRDFIHTASNKGFKNTSINHHLSALRSFYRYMLNEGYINENPTEGITNIKIPEYIPTWLTEEEMSLILSAPDTDTLWGARDAAILELLYATGIRVGELCNLKIGDVYFDPKHLSSRIKVMGKGSKERVIPINEMAERTIAHYLYKRAEHFETQLLKTDWLFISRSGDQLNRRTVGYLVKRYAQYVGIEKDVHPHVIRHTFASQLSQRGVNLEFLRRMMGHSKLETTQRYVHASDEEIAKAYRKFHPRMDL